MAKNAANISNISPNPTNLSFKEIRSVLLRIQELKVNNKLDRYYILEKFLDQIIPEWLSIEQSRSDSESLKELNTEIKAELLSPQILSEQMWTQVWQKTNPLWKEYWSTYAQLHADLRSKLEQGKQQIENHPNYATLDQKTLKIIQKELKDIQKLFTCANSIKIPPEVPASEKGFLCSSCETSYAVLKFREKDIESKISILLEKLKTHGGIVPPPPVDPPEPPIPPVPEHPTKEEKESWKAYQKEHSECEAQLEQIYAQCTLFQDHPKKKTIVQKTLAEIKKKYSTFAAQHICTAESDNWEINHQVCAVCKLTYNQFIDLKDFLESILDKLKDQLIDEQEIILPFKKENTYQLSSLEDVPTLLQAQNQILSAFFSNYFKLNSEQKKSKKADEKNQIKINIEISRDE